MEKSHALGSSGLLTPPLILGGNVFGWTSDRSDAFAVLDTFVDKGGVMIDTADVYSAWVPGHQGGESETMIGEWLAKSGRRNDVLIATKVGMLAGEGGDGLKPARIAAAIDASLKRLGTDRVDLYFAHCYDPATPVADMLEAFDTLVKAGKVRALGASNYTADRLQEALSSAATNTLTPFTVIQPEYNLVARDGFEGALRDICITHDIGVISYYALAAGFLSGKYRSEADLGKSARGAGMRQLITGRGRSILAAMDVIADEAGASVAQVALAWVMAQPGITAPIASATSVAQLNELLGALTLTLNADQLSRLDIASQP